MTWLPFDLHPEYPPEGIPRAQLVARYGDQFHERLKRQFEAQGLVYNPPPDVVPNTRHALRLTELARDLDAHEAFHDRLMDAYWRDGVDIGDRDELRKLLHDLPSDDLDGVLTGERYRDRVLASTEQAQSAGINGIPAWVIDGKLLVPGAQPREVFDRVFEQLEAD